MIQEIQSVISASPSPLERLANAREAETLGRLFKEVRQARAERVSSQSSGFSVRAGQAVTAAAQGVSSHSLASDKVSFSAQAQQLSGSLSSVVAPNPTSSPERTEIREAELEGRRNRARQLGRRAGDDAGGGRDESGKPGRQGIDSVAEKAERLFLGLRSDFESALSGQRKEDAGVEGARPDEKPASVIRALRNGSASALSSPDSARSRDDSTSSSLRPLIGLKIEKDDAGNFSITKLPNRVRIAEQTHDLAAGSVTLELNGGGAVNSSKDRGLESGVLGLAVRGEANVKLAPKDGKIGVTAAAKGRIEVGGVKVQLDEGTSILIGSDSKGRVQISESETRVSVGKRTFRLRGGETIRLGGGSDPSSDRTGGAFNPASGVSRPSVPKDAGFTPLLKAS